MSRREVYTIPKRWLIPTQINKTARPNLYWIKKDFITKLLTYTSIQLFPTIRLFIFWQIFMSCMEVYTIPKRRLIPTQINKTARPNLYWIKKDFIIKLLLSGRKFNLLHPTYLNIVGVVRYRQASPGIVQAPKTILMICFLTLISWYFTGLVLDWQYWVLDHIVSESICLKFSQWQTFYAHFLHPLNISNWILQANLMTKLLIFCQRFLSGIGTIFQATSDDEI